MVDFQGINAHIREDVNFSAKSIQKRIYSCDGKRMKTRFKCIFDKCSLKLVISCKIMNFSASKTKRLCTFPDKSLSMNHYALKFGPKMH